MCAQNVCQRPLSGWPKCRSPRLPRAGPTCRLSDGPGTDHPFVSGTGAGEQTCCSGAWIALPTEPVERAERQMFMSAARPVLLVFPLLLALSGCGLSDAVSTSGSGEETETQIPEADPFDKAATNRPELLVISPPTAEPGDQVELSFPQGTSRGVAFTLEEAARGGWAWTHVLTSGVDGYSDGKPSWVARGTSYGWDDIGVNGLGPDLILLPDGLDPGAHRICTANAGTNFCGEMTVTGSATGDDTATTTSNADVTAPPAKNAPPNGAAPPVDPADLTVSWTDAEGRELPDGVGEPDPDLVINTIQGPEHCGWEKAVLMHLSVPVGSVSKSSDEVRQYVRDPDGVLGRPELMTAFDATATLPDDAEPTGIRNGSVELWVAPSSLEQEVYMGRDGMFEAWPRATELIACA